MSPNINIMCLIVGMMLIMLPIYTKAQEQSREEDQMTADVMLQRRTMTHIRTSISGDNRSNNDLVLNF